jgi:hypothetical protein
MKSIFASAAAALAITAFATPAWSSEYRYESVVFPGAVSTTLYAVNNLRQFVGAKRDEVGAHRAIWNDGTSLQLLDSLRPRPHQGELGPSRSTRTRTSPHVHHLTGGLHGYLRHGDGRHRSSTASSPAARHAGLRA